MPSTSTLTQPWLATGYTLFAAHGPDALRVEQIARIVGKSKSSFYHHFADMEVFTNLLLEMHMDRCREIAAREKECQNIDPELIDILVEVKEDILFNRHLRINRQNAQFQHYLQLTTQQMAEAFLDLWARELGLEDKPALVRSLFEHSIENFYLQLTDQTLTHEWLRSYFEQVRKMVGDFKKL